MKKWVRLGLALAVTGSMLAVQAPTAEAGLFAKLFGKKDECCCCEPEPVCCEPEPVCCEPEPVCCEPEPEPVCCEPEPEPVCCEPEPEPVCCEPEPAPEPCCASYSMPELAPGEVLVSISPILMPANRSTVQVAVKTPVRMADNGVMLVKSMK
ncbi:hypothetical protein [Neorhodopirellula pilleata]|uniref:Uncharacterized protein n=1 Tax=Neorhodopirellula pilleata TaxID=2714738 RepID=A0A5C6AWP7_9BACT|nr:hypothetical protein [Neorhodopirellula pilleata]TWU03496.1 hypothetical protein Pla100_04230 [Neorhodopirellula pilleata]